jgi:MFS family permease
MTAMSFTDVSIISVFVVKALGSTFLAGLMQTFRTLGFFIPQILSVNIGSEPLKKKIFFKWTVLSRSSLLLSVLTILFIEDLNLIILSILVSLSLLALCDGFTIIPWLEFVAKSIPARKRGSFFGISQFIGAVGTLLGSFLISRVLNNPNLAFPKNYGLLILLETIFLFCGLIFIFPVKEKPDEVIEEKRSLRNSLKKIPKLFDEDVNFRNLVIVQVLVSFFSLVNPFYSIYSISVVDAGEGFVGLLLSFQMIGKIIFSFVFAYLCNLGLNKKIIQITSSMLIVTPLLAVFFGTFQLPMEVVRYGILLVFSLLGASLSGVFLGFNNYVLDSVERSQRSLYLGFLNFLYIITSILPLLGGFLVEYLSYELVFLSSTIPLSIGLLLTFRLE